MLDTVGMTPEEIAIANQQMEQQLANLESGVITIVIGLVIITILILVIGLAIGIKLAKRKNKK